MGAVMRQPWRRMTCGSSKSRRLLGVVWGKCPVEALGELWKDGWEVMGCKVVADRWTAGAESRTGKEPSSAQQ